MKSIKRLIHRAKWLFLDNLVKLKQEWARRLYWDLRAQEIHDTWGQEKSDYTTLREVIELVRPVRLLDVGCGSGRCFPLYLEAGIPEVLGQDISKRALTICKETHAPLSYQLFCGTIEALARKYPEDHFDLIISTRTLSAVVPGRIAGTVAILCRMGRNIYLNEMTDTDYAGPSNSWFKHDYDALMIENRFYLIRRGTISVVEKGETFVQTWSLFGKQERMPRELQ